MRQEMLECSCGNDEFKVKIITDQRMENNPNKCDTITFYCAFCNKGKAVRYESRAKQAMPGVEVEG